MRRAHGHESSDRGYPPCDLVLVTHSDTQVHSSAELKRATVSVFLTVGFCFDDELEYKHLNPGGKGWGIEPRVRGRGFGASWWARARTLVSKTILTRVHDIRGARCGGLRQGPLPFPPQVRLLIFG